MKDKLISFPEEVLEALEKFKEKTGVNSSDYIRIAVCRQMISDRLLDLRGFKYE